MELINLIKEITPLYNKYKQDKEKLSGTESLIIMWEIGNLLKEYADNTKIAPHNLYRQIYGKSEGKENIAQRSYITREFQGRCFRIRNIFTDKKEIKKQLSGLKDFTSFREAMPFFDNPIYKLEQNDFNALLKLLNSDQKSSDIIKKLDIQKKSINNIANPRTQKLEELEKEKQIFITFYNYLYNQKKNHDYKEVIKSIGIGEIELINTISKNLSALAQEGIKKYDMPKIETTNTIVNDFYIMLKKIISPKDEKERRRFRRIIPPERIIKLAEMVYSLTSEKQFIKR